jgi:hypothetical protein
MDITMLAVEFAGMAAIDTDIDTVADGLADIIEMDIGSAAIKFAVKTNH